MKELFNDGKIQVFTNGAGEIFVKNLKNLDTFPLEIRIGTYNRDLLQITAYGRVFEPHSFNGLGGFIIK